MSTNGDAADLIVREAVQGGIQITKFALKLAGLGAKNLAALLIALANDEHKFAGKTTLKRLLRDGEELTIFSIKEEDLAKIPKSLPSIWRFILQYHQPNREHGYGGDHGQGQGRPPDQSHSGETGH